MRARAVHGEYGFRHTDSNEMYVFCWPPQRGFLFQAHLYVYIIH